MRSTEALISTYLDTIKKLTDSDSVNIVFSDPNGIKNAISNFQLGSCLLPEFDSQNLEVCLPPNEDKQLYSKDKLTVYSGNSDDTLIIYFQSSLFEISAYHRDPNLHPQNRRKGLITNNKIDTVSMWMGLKFSSESKYLDKNGISQESIDQLSNLLADMLPLSLLMFDHTEVIESILSDPVTQLSGRVEFQSNLQQLISNYSHVAVFLVHPNEFQHINKKFGHDSGDTVISSIARNLKSILRETDLISRFGGALFAVATPLRNPDEIKDLVRKIQHNLQGKEYLKGAISLSFNIGAAIYEDETEYANSNEPEKLLIQHADIALHSAQLDRATDFVLWHPDENEKFQSRQDYIGAIFTADTATDYRNMLLLWDISNIIASYNQFEQLFIEVVQRLSQTFDFKSCGVINFDKDGKFKTKLAFKINSEGNANRIQKNQASFNDSLFKALGEESRNVKIFRQIDDKQVVFTAPFNEVEDGVFYLVGHKSRFELEEDSQLLLTALAKQIGRAIARAQLEEQLNEHLFNQKQKLQTELNALKQSVQSTQLIYCSRAMEILIKQARRAATSDTTTLIIGESGTGKERLVHTMHQEGTRQDKPLIIVDCSAIPESLIESELFGHVKGAYTGATSQSKGRILEAAGGTLMLDEIGELPLLVQSKLLRFVQEKHFTPVGGHKTISVDVKIIAVTNRELEDEVAQGRFRQDLFYRLNVLVLRTPPLRERPEDITLLANHFIAKYSQQYNVPIKTLSTEAAANMDRYSWPGNVRELENRIMQAMLMSESEEIHFADLRITDDTKSTSSKSIAPIPEEFVQHDQLEKHSEQIKSTSNNNFISLPKENEIKVDDYIQQIKNEIGEQIQEVLDNALTANAPLGKWLDDDLLSTTFHACQNNAQKTALRLGLPLSTIRRRLKKITVQEKEHIKHRTSNWQEMLNTLHPIASGKISIGDDSTRQLKMILLASILNKIPNNAAVASALLGVSEPTYYKLKKQLAQNA